VNVNFEFFAYHIFAYGQFEAPENVGVDGDGGPPN
tara:strand:- start:181 stop:285 length:105 start_codon:yes stop_codon:yes gene_type:complete